MSHDIDEIGRMLRSEGYRLTPQRQMILDAVCQLGGHVTTESVFRQVQKHTAALNVTTVYRNLQFLAERKILTVTHLGQGKLGYELAHVHLHHHLLCVGCGASIEIDHEALSSFYELMNTQHRFCIDMNHITFQGRCAACQTQLSDSENAN